MVKYIYGWRDRPGLSAKECERHYREVHMELARTAYDGVDGFQALAYDRVRRHAVNDHNQPEAHDLPPDIDAFCQLWFRDEESLRAAFGSPALAAMFADHVNFMDTESAANIRIYQVEETVFLGRRPEGQPS